MAALNEHTSVLAAILSDISDHLNLIYILLDNLLKTQPKLLPKNLIFRPLSEAFIRRSWYSVLPVLDTTGRRRVKKAVVCVAQLVAALITVHGLLSFLPDVYGLF